MASASMILLSSCLSFFPVDAFRTIDTINGQQLGLNLPEVDIVLNAAGGDAIDVYFDGPASARFEIAEGAARWLGAPGAPAFESDYLEDTVTVQLDRRLAERRGDLWTLTFDTSVLQQIVQNAGFEGVYLFVCHPTVETRLGTSQPPDYGLDGSPCSSQGFGWLIVDDPVRATVTMTPDVADFLAFIAAVVLCLVLVGALAGFVGNTLRRTTFRRRSPAAVAIGLIAGGMLSVFFIGGIAMTAVIFGPADNLALAKDLGAGLYAASVGGPAILGAIPGVILAVLLVRRRRGDEQPAERTFTSWPAPPPPGGTSRPPPPPPLPWGVR